MPSCFTSKRLNDGASELLLEFQDFECFMNYMLDSIVRILLENRDKQKFFVFCFFKAKLYFYVVSKKCDFLKYMEKFFIVLKMKLTKEASKDPISLTLVLFKK